MKKNTNNKPPTPYQEQTIHTGHFERLRNRFIANSFSTFEESEILDLLLTQYITRADTGAIARDLILKFGSLAGVFDASIDDLKLVNGVGEKSALFIKIVGDVSKIHSTNEQKYNAASMLTPSISTHHNIYIKNRLKLPPEVVSTNMQYKVTQTFPKMLPYNNKPKTVIRSHNDICNYCQSIHKEFNVEQFHLTCLNSSFEVIFHKLVSEGDSESTIFDSRKVIKYALLSGGNLVVISHNHTNNSSTASLNDICSTKAMKQMLKFINVDLLDHIIVTKTNMTSMSSTGLLSQ